MNKKSVFFFGFCCGIAFILATPVLLAHNDDAILKTLKKLLNIISKDHQQLKEDHQNLHQEHEQLRKKLDSLLWNTEYTYRSPQEIISENPDATSGVYWFKVKGKRFPAFCRIDLTTTEKQKIWVMLYNSVKNEWGAAAQGDVNTLKFWRISYHERFGIKGKPSLGANYYNGWLYLVGRATYRDEVENLQGKSGLLFQAEAPQGINPTDMRFPNPQFDKELKGIHAIFHEQFAHGWSSYDKDGDFYDPVNCASYRSSQDVTQHYRACYNYNLGSLPSDTENKCWGPYLHSPDFPEGIKPGGTPRFVRVNRITRWVTWN